jgi:hypothetical protein
MPASACVCKGSARNQDPSKFFKPATDGCQRGFLGQESECLYGASDCGFMQISRGNFTVGSMESLDLTVEMHDFVVSMKLDTDMTAVFDVQLSLCSQETDERQIHG